jgi:trk system potassium uptake protein TrkA
MGIVLDEDCPVVNTPLRQLTDLFSTLRAVVVGVRREGTLFAPEAGDQLFVGDQVYVFTHTEDIQPHAGDLRQDRRSASRSAW